MPAREPVVIPGTARPRHRESPTHCIACGYDLRGLGSTTTHCPECGLDFRTAAASLSQDAARKIQRGARTVFIGMIAIIVPPIAVPIESAGWWILTSDHREVARSNQQALGFWIRSLTLALNIVLLPAIVMPIPRIRGAIGIGSGPLQDAIIAISLVGLVAIWVLRQWLGCLFFKRIATTLGSRRLRSQAAAAAWMTIAIAVTGFVVIVLGGVVFHIVIIPPICFIPILWFAFAVAWYFVLASLAWDISIAARRQPPQPAPPPTDIP